MKNFSGIVAWYSADRIPGILSYSSNISVSLIFTLNSKIALVFKTEMLNWTANEESLLRVGRFHLELLCGFGGQWFCLRKVFWDQCYNLTFSPFSPSNVMILLAFLSCFVVFFFFVKDQKASFQLKYKANHYVFELSVPCVCLFHCVTGTEFDYRIQYNQFSVALHAIHSLNVKHGLQYFLVCHLKIVFYFLHELKQRSRSSDISAGWH